jgi:hypothetical protein
MREAGRKRPKDQLLRDRPERGRLAIHMANSSEVTYLPGEMERSAFFRVRMTDIPCDLVHRLHTAELTVMGDDSFVVVGIERIHMEGGRTQDFPQAWWCRFAQSTAVEVADRAGLMGGGPAAAVASV